MKKRLLALLVVLALLLTCIPTGVVAEGTDQGQLLTEGQEETTKVTAEAETTQAVVTPEPNSHDDAAHKCEHCDQFVTWTEWGDDLDEKNTLPNGQGHYVLVDHIDVSSAVTTTDKADIVLCLNGYTVNGGNSKYFYRVGSKTNDTSSLTISDCNHEVGQLINGYHGDTSGAIYVRYNARFYMYAGKFVNNTNAQPSALTGYSGGAIQVRNTAQAVIKNVEFSGNHTTAEGGAICIRQSGQVTLENVVLKDNTADRLGGAIFLDSAGCQLTVKNCTFENNQSEQSGGAIYVQGGTVSIENSTFTQNGAEADGGAIYAPHAQNVTITGSTFDSNTAVNGGALYVTGTKTVTAENCTFKANTATGNGGAVFVTGADSVFETTNCIFGGDADADGNQTTGNGGAISNTEGGSVTITGGVLKHNQATNRGGAIYTNKSDVTVTGTAESYVLFEENHGQGSSNGGGVYAVGDCDVRLQYVEMTGNTLGGSGGSAVMFTGGARGYIADATFTGNSNEKIDAYRGAVYVTGTTSVLTLSGKVIIKDNAAGNLYVQNNNYNRTNDDCWVVVDGLTEGSEIILNTYASVAEDEERLNNRILDGQPEDWTEGWITYNYLPVVYNKDEDKFFIGTSTHIHCACGAHLVADAEGCTHEVTPGCDHSEIIYEPWGDPTSLPTSGAIYLETNVELPQNVAINGELKICLNGYIISAEYEEQGNTKDRVFTLNNNDKLTISDCSAKTEGGVYTAGKLTGSSSTAIMVANNTGKDEAGNEIVNSVVINFFDGILTGNTSSAGAAFSIQDGATLNMYGGEISGNHSTNLGGAIYVGSQGNLNIYGGTITGNAAETKGAVYVTASTLAMYGGTITGNTAAEGAGVYLNNSSLTLGGTPEILGNTADGVLSNLYLAGTSLIAFDQLDAGEAQIGVDADAVLRFISNDMGENNHLAYFTADRADRKIQINNNRLYLVVSSDHAHCGCGDGTSEYCDHVQNEFAPWDDPTSLPTSGAIYLKTNVALAANVAVSGELKICLNGYTISAEYEEQGSSKDRLFTLNGADKLSISDCTAKTVDGVYTAGKLTGSSYTAVMIANSSTSDNTVVVNFYDGIFTGNESTTGAAFSIQDGATLNMYGGEISGNIAKLATDSEGNTSGGNGGAVYVGTNATFNMYGGTITGNTSEESGTVYVTAASKLNMYGGAITGNTAAKNAGGVLLNGSATVMTMQGGEISNNVAGGAAGGVLAQVRATLNLEGGKISENTAVKGGGGIYVSYTSSVNMEGGEISNNKTDGNGGGMYVLGAEITLKGGKLSGNYAVTSGGGIYATYYKRSATETREEKIYTAKLDLTGVTVSGNKTDGNGAGVCTSKATVVNLSGGSITGNAAVKAAGGILLQSKSVLNFKGGSVSSNSAKSGGGVYISTDSFIYMTGGSVSYNTATGNSGGMYLLRCEATLAGGTISNNTTEANGGGIYISGAQVKLTGTSIKNNVAEGNGGGICTTRAKSTTNGVTTEYYTSITMTGGTVSGNSGVNGGGILLQSKSSMTLKGGLFENNKTTKGGAGLYISSTCTFFMEGGTVQNNEAEGNGAGIYHYKSAGTYTGGLIKGNTAAAAAGGMLISGEGYAVTLKEGIVITENTSVNGGAIVVQNRATLNMENVDLTNNTATSGNGGAIYLSTNSFLNIQGGSITNHSCDANGGAIFTHTNSTLNMDGTTISGNKAGYGGALSLGGTANIENVSITQNEAVNEGGGIYCHKLKVGGLFEDHLITVKNAVIESNKAGTQGGGVYVLRGSKCLFDGLTVTGNISGGEGGGLYVVDDTSMYNMTVTGNTSGGEGHALYLADSEYDGESYFIGIFKLGGVMKVSGNTGGDMYFGNQTAAAVDHMGLTGDTLMNIKLHSGYLTQVLQGVYNYEGGNLEYVVTAGDRSVTDPEYDPAYNDQFKTEEPTEEATGEGADGQTEQSGVSPLVWIACGAGAVVIAAVIAIIAALGKKKKAAAKK